jgi:uncharacterized membrane protein YkvA (DUF1232 family)
MKYSQLLKLLEASGLSPEQLGSRLGISGMTLRRWKQSPPEGELPVLYRRAVEEALSQLIQEGRIHSDSPLVREILDGQDQSSFQNTLKNLGISEAALQAADKNPENILQGLSEIGSMDARREEVHRQEDWILSFKKRGKDWRQRVSVLLKVLRSKEIKGFEKFPAYGALFYLINPFDLIPDHFLGFGYFDDFVILGMASVYYLRRFSKYLQ